MSYIRLNYRSVTLTQTLDYTILICYHLESAYVRIIYSSTKTRGTIYDQGVVQILGM